MNPADKYSSTNTPATAPNLVTNSAQTLPAPTPARELKCTFTPAPGSPWSQVEDAPAPARASTLTLTRYTAHNPKRLSKAFTLSNGQLVKHPGGNLIDGRADRIETDIAGLVDLLQGLGPQHALGYGIAKDASARVITRDAYDRAEAFCETETENLVARTREHFTWPAGPGVMMIDYDPPATGEALTREQLLSALTQSAPALANAGMIWRPSASSCIYTSDDQELRGIAGQRLYILIQDARDIPRAGQALSDRLWLTGHGRIDLSASGAMLERTIIDSAVWQPERLDFAGGADCGPGLEQRLPAPLLINQDAGYLDSRLALPDLTNTERAQLATLKEEARTAQTDAAHALRETWIGERVETTIKRLPKEQRAEAKARIERTYRTAAEGGALGPDVVIQIQGMGERTVQQIMAKPAQYHSKLCRDPLDPGYQSGKLVGWINTKSATPYINSMAHGGTRYTLAALVQEPAAALNERRDLSRDLSRLAGCSPAQITNTALAIAQRYAGESPRKRDLSDLVKAIEYALPPDTNPALKAATITAIERQTASYRQHAIAQAMSASRLTFGSPAGSMAELVQQAITAPTGTILLLKGPQGCGKTQELLRPVADHFSGKATVIAISNTVSLVGDLATRLSLADYKNATPGQLEGSDGLAICINSLNNPKFSEILNRPNTVVLIDEVARVLAGLHDPRGTLRKNAQPVLATWTRLMQKARLVIGVDADLNNQTVQTISALRGPEQALSIHTVESQWALPTIRFGEERQIWSEIISAVANGEKVMITSDSAGRVIRLAKMLRTFNPGKKIVEIQSRQGVATTGDPKIVALLKDINSGLDDIDVLLCSPAVESGISITKPHFTRHFALYAGVLAPAQIIQQMRRDRTATTITLGFCGNLTRNDPTDPGAILANLDVAHRETVTASIQAGDGYTVTHRPAGDYDRRVCAYLAQDAVARNHGDRNLLLLLEGLGYVTERLSCAAPEVGKDDLAMARDLELQAEELAIQSAADISETEREKIRQSYQPTPEQSAESCRYDIRQVTGKVDDFIPLEEFDLLAWRNGALVGEANRFKALQGDPEAAAIDAQDEENNVTLSQRSHRQALVNASRALFEAAGLNPDNGTGTVTKTSALSAWQAMKASPHGAVLERHRIARLEKKPPAYPVRWLNQAFAKFGLALEEKAEIRLAEMLQKETNIGMISASGRMQTYTIRRTAKYDKAGVRIKTPGWDAMREYHAAQAAMPRARIFSPQRDVHIDLDAVINSARQRRRAAA